MTWQLVATDNDAGRSLAFLDDFDAFAITPRLNGYAEIAFGLAALDSAASAIAVARTSVKAYQDGALRFFGKVWEPLSRSGARVAATARDPLAEFLWRRAPADADYTATNNAGGPWDAGQIAYDRLAIQNARRNTYLRAGARQPSLNRLRSYTAGQKENEILDELASAAGGFFYKAVPVDGVAGVMSDLNLYYPNAGVSREEVRFEYGPNTADNLADFEQVEMLPRNGMNVASSSAGGGRLVQRAEDADSIALYGLFEDETAYSDVVDTTLLAQQAQAQIKPDPPLTLALTPALGAPLLFADFNVGDFVRVRILWGGVDLFTWARVLEATLTVTREGVETLTAIVVEVLVGGQIATDPNLLFRAQLDDDRRRLEALERRVQALTATGMTVADSPAAPAAGGGSSDPTYTPPPEPAAPPPEPSVAPPEPPTVGGLNSYGTSTHSLDIEFDADGHGTYAEASVWIDTGGTPTRLTSVAVGEGGGHFHVSFDGLARNTFYNVHVRANSAGGSNQADGSARTFSVDPI